MTIEISKIQIRRGAQADLPGAANAGLDAGEMALATDTNRVFIGSAPEAAAAVKRRHGAPSAGDAAFPYGNVEVLTEFSPANQAIFDALARDVSTGFLASLPMVVTGPDAWAFVSVQRVSGADGAVTQAPFVIAAQDAQGRLGFGQVSYFVVDAATGTPMRTGRLTVLHAGNAFPPALADDAVANPYSGFSSGALPVDPNLRYGLFTFRALPTERGIALQYQINMTGGALPVPVMFFRVEQPALTQPALVG